MTHRVGVAGVGYVGLTTAVCLAARGIDTVCVDVDTTEVDALNRGMTVLDEPGLHDLLGRGLSSGSLRFESDFGQLADCDVVFVCVPTAVRTEPRTSGRSSAWCRNWQVCSARVR